MIRHLIALIGEVVLCGGCSTKVVDCPPERFRALYDSRRYPEEHADYVGVKHGYHYIGKYGTGPTDCAPHREFYARIKVNELPAGFPDHPQKPISPMTEQERQEQRRREESRQFLQMHFTR